MNVVRQFLLLLLMLSMGLAPSCGNRKRSVHNSNAEPEVTAQVQTSQFRVLTAAPQLKSLSPYTIRDFINESDKNGTESIHFSPVWDMMQIKSEEDRFDGFIPAHNRWQATVFPVHRAGGKARYVILKISTPWKEDRRYLIFKDDSSSLPGDARWQFLGHIDYYFERHLDHYSEIRHSSYQRIVTDGENTWLVLRYQSGSGTGAFSVSEAWHKIDGKPTEVLDYPIYGYFNNDYVTGRVYDSRIVGEQRLRGKFSVKIRFSATYGDDGAAFTKRQTATYLWDSDSGRFVLDRQKSDLSEEELEEVYRDGVMIEDENFLSYYFSDLKWIATHGNEKQREWLGRSLNRLKDSPQKRALESFLISRR